MTYASMENNYVDDEVVEIPEEQIEQPARSPTPGEIDDEELPDELVAVSASKLRQDHEQLRAQLQSLRLKTQLATLAGALEVSSSLSAKRQAYTRQAKALQEEAKQLRQQPIDLSRANEVTRLEDELKARELELSNLVADGTVLSHAVEERTRAWEQGESFGGSEQEAAIKALRESVGEKKSLVAELRSEKAASDRDLRLKRLRCDKLAAMLKAAAEHNAADDAEKAVSSAKPSSKPRTLTEEKEAREEAQAREKAAQLREAAAAAALKREREAHAREAVAKEVALKRLQDHQALVEKYRSEVAESEQEVEKGDSLLRALRAAVQAHQRQEAKENKAKELDNAKEGTVATELPSELAPDKKVPQKPTTQRTSSQPRPQGKKRGVTKPGLKSGTDLPATSESSADERRLDPYDGQLRTFQALRAHYANDYSNDEIKQYWQEEMVKQSAQP